MRNNRCETFSNKKNKCIILTTYITNENITMYYKKLSLWLKTGIDIYLVDSNNRGFHIDNNNYHQYVFDQSKQDYYFKGMSISILELESLNRIIKHFDLTNKYEYIYKITGKYFIDDYRELDVKGDYDMILQSIYYPEKRWHNSELVGLKSSKILKMLQIIRNREDSNFERGLGFLKSQGYTYKILKKLPVNNKHGYVKRSIGDTLEFL